MPASRLGAQAGRPGGSGEQTDGGEEVGVGQENRSRPPGADGGPETEPPLETAAAAVLPDERELPEHGSVPSWFFISSEVLPTP